MHATYVSGPHDAADLLHRVKIRAQTTVHGEDLLVDDSGDGQAVEAVRESLPQLDVVPALALVVEAVDTVDGGTLVVAAQDEKVLGVLDLVCEQKADGLEGLLASVDVIAEEEVVGLWGEAAVFEKAQQIVVLAVDITANLRGMSAVPCGHVLQARTNLDGSLKLEQDRLRDEDRKSVV